MNADLDELSEHERQLGAVLFACLETVEAGQAPDLAPWLARYPQFAPELTKFFADRARLDRAAAPLRAVASAVRAATPRPEHTAPSRPTSPAEAASLPGNRPRAFGDYELLRELGRGGMGVVFEARQISLKRRVALKMIRTGFLATPADRQRFRAEAEAAASLDHPHIVPIYDVGELEGQPYFTMKLVSGGSLADSLSRFVSDPRTAAGLLVMIARAAHHAHQHAILHRDLKPANILLDAEGQPHVTDFGLAKQLASDTSMTQSGEIVGSPVYMAPEQAAGQKRAVTTATDVYGLGAILYALLTGRPPFRGETPLEALQQVREVEPTPPRHLNPRVDRDLETICLKCLQKERHRRYDSAAALADDLGRWLAGKPILARPISLLARLSRWCRRKPVAATAALLLTVVLAGLPVSTYLIWREQQRTQEALHQEGEQRQRAETSYRLAREALEQAVQSVAEDPRLQSGPLEDLRRKAREAEKGFFEKFVNLQGDNPAFQLERARAYALLGFITQELGSKDGAIAHYRQALGIATSLAGDYPGMVEHEAELRLAYNNLGEILRQTGRLGEGEPYLLQAVAVAKKLVSDHPGKTEYSVDLARTENNLGLLLSEARRPNEAEQSFNDALAVLQTAARRDAKHLRCRSEQARTYANLGLLYRSKDVGRPKDAQRAFEDSLAIRQALVRDHPKEVEYRFELGRSLSNFGAWYWESRQLAKAEQALNEAIAVLKDLVKMRPAVPEYQAQLAGAHANLGLVYQSTKQVEKSLEAHRRAVALDKKLADEYPASADYQTRLGRSLHSLADVLYERDPAETRRLVEQAIDCQRAALKISPAHEQYRLDLRDHYWLLADTLLNLGEHVDAARAAEESTRVVPKHAETYFQASRYLASCIRSAGQDKKLSQEERQKLVEAYARQTLDLLLQAVRAGFRDTAALEKETAFAPLRSREEFQQIVRELRKPK
jgi:serine/threonine protein kinase/Tfp pilus assembly protein PilF